MDVDDRPTVSRQGAVARIRLCRPAQRNALRPADLRHLLDAFAEIDGEPGIRAAVLEADVRTDGHPVFCAGFDLAGFRDPEHDPDLFERVADALEALRPITVCALSGSVHGGATDLVLACDLRVAVRGARFRMPALELGLHYYPGGLRRFVSRLGIDLAKRAFLGSRALTVEELQAVGLFDAIVEPQALEAHVAALADRAVRLAPTAAQDTKRSLQEIADGVQDEWRLHQREARSLLSRDFAEGLAAIAAGRAPDFDGT